MGMFRNQYKIFLRTRIEKITEVLGVDGRIILMGLKELRASVGTIINRGAGERKRRMPSLSKRLLVYLL
jgi:hypothetical protein